MSANEASHASKPSKPRLGERSGTQQIADSLPTSPDKDADAACEGSENGNSEANPQSSDKEPDGSMLDIHDSDQQPSDTVNEESAQKLNEGEEEQEEDTARSVDEMLQDADSYYTQVRYT